jgi:signal transduction histidine kinase
VAVSDITSLKQAEEAQRRAEILTAVNRELELEIARRQAVEKALKQSQQEQGRLLAQSRGMQQQLRRLSHQILHAQEEERRRISRDLHDEVTQILTGINIHLHALARKAKVNPEGLDHEILQTQRLVEKSVVIVHQFARELRPPALDDLGLSVSLHSYLDEYMKRTGLKVHFTTFTSGRIEKLNSAMRTVFYRVAQEALLNVAQHANASQVKVSLQKLAGAVQLEITDDGKSFEVNQVLHTKKNKRLGLIGMQERVEMVGGRFKIVSAPGLGTTVQARIPLSKAGRGHSR